MTNNAPPNETIPVIHSLCELYKQIYLLTPKIQKRDRFGIYLKVELFCIELLNLLISAAFESRHLKINTLIDARVKIEVLKRFIRLLYELKIIELRKYTDFESRLQEISKMTNGWIRYLQ